MILKQKKKIIHIVQLQLLYGSQRVALDICNNLNRDDYEIWIACAPSEDKGNAFTQEVARLKLNKRIIPHFRRSLGPWDVLAFFELYGFFRKHKFDIVHTHGSKSGVLGRLAARLAGVKRVVHTVHGVPYHDQLPKAVQACFRTAEWFAGLFCDSVVFVSDNQRCDAIQRKVVPTNKAITIYNGVEEIARRSRDYTGNELLIGSVGRFWDQKNYPVTIKAAIEACKRNPALRFAFLGDGEYYESCLGMVREHGMQDRIELPGWQDNVHQWLERFDVFLLYSLWEGLPVAILEAMNAGLPVIASDIDGNNELVDESNGYLIDVTQPEILIERLTGLTDNRELLKKMSDASVRRIQECFLLKRMTEEYLKVYDA